MRIETNLMAVVWGGQQGRIAAIETAPDPSSDQPIDWVYIKLSTGVQWYPAWQITATYPAIDGTGIVPPRFSMSNTEVRHDPAIHATE